MRTLAETSLTPEERRAVERFARAVEAELGPDLRGVWLYGSRARGEEPHEESDVDLLVISARGDSLGEHVRLLELADAAAGAEGARRSLFSVKVYDPELIDQRREIKSFFIQEVDRDKIVLAGEP
jgi:predicted nucleotidyltransferase